MKVYLVSSDYDDYYHFDAIFSDEEKAEEYRKCYRHDRVEEWQLDPDFPKMIEGYHGFYVEIGEQGKPTHIWESSYGSVDDEYGKEATIFYSRIRERPLSFRIGIIAKDKKQAVKEATRYRNLLMANRNKIPNEPPTKNQSFRVIKFKNIL